MNPIDYPRVFFVLSVVVLWLSALLGAFIGQKVRPLKQEEREDFAVVQTAILTLLGLLIGFAFSTSERTTRKLRRVRSVQNTFGQTFCLPEMQKKYGTC